MRFRGLIRATVGREQRFISNDPSPSRAMTLRRGSPKAIPKAMDEQSPKVRTRKLASLGLKACHSSVVAPAELTTNASPARAASAFKQSKRFIRFYFSFPGIYDSPRNGHQPIALALPAPCSLLPAPLSALFIAFPPEICGPKLPSSAAMLRVVSSLRSEPAPA